MEASRHPLKDLSTNSPSVKRQKVLHAREGDLERQAHNNNAHLQQQHQQQAALPLGEWQRKWKSIMKTTVVYFDLSNAQDFTNRERETASRLFTGAGATLVPFFDNDVTIVITKRAKSDLPKNMANNDGIKVWDYVKVFRFFKNLGEKVPHSRDTHVPTTWQEKATNGRDTHLSTMWQDEKIHGVADRDPNAKRDDFYYFKYPYFHVFDLRDIAKPVSTREWKKEKWPQLHESTCGYSLFQEEPSDVMDERKVRRRKFREQQLADFRKRLREVYEEDDKTRNIFYYPSSNDQTSEDSTMHSHNVSISMMNTMMKNNTEVQEQGEEEEEENNDDDDEGVDDETSRFLQEGNDTLPQMLPPQPAFQHGGRPPVLSRQTSALQNKFIEMTKRDHIGEIQASGYNGSVSQQSAEFQTQNGLAPVVSTASSKQLNTLQRKVVKKPVLATNTNGHASLRAQANVPIATTTTTAGTTSTTTTTSAQHTSHKKEKVDGYCENCKIQFDDFDEHIISSKHREFAMDETNFEAIDQLIEDLKQNIRSKR